jgi:3'-5' exoribonuclease
MAPASVKHHHAYPHGLLEHTADVVQRCENAIGSATNRNILLTAAIWHDFHKIYEYAMFRIIKSDDMEMCAGTIEIEHTMYAKTIGHIAGSYHEWVVVAEHAKLPSSTIAAIAHCILSHHGRSEWGSPIEPHTDEAFILHSMDMRSVQEAKSYVDTTALRQFTQTHEFTGEETNSKGDSSTQ